MIDDAFARCEAALTVNTAVGLTDEGVDVVRCVSQNLLPELTATLFEPPIAYQPGIFRLTRGIRAMHLADAALARYAETGGIQVVHVYGGRLWWLAATVARRLRCPLVVEVWRPGLFGKARALAARAAVPVTLLAPDPATERTLLQESAGSAVRLACWGVHAPSRPTARQNAGVRSILLAGPGRDADRANAAFIAAARVLEARDDVYLFVDARMARRAGLWKLADRLGVRDRMSLVSHLEQTRELVTRLDLMIYPERRGEMRTLLLDVMAAGMPVLACDEPSLACLRDGETVCTVEGASPDRWEQQIAAFIDSPEQAAALGSSARAWVREHRRLSGYVASVLDVYEAVTTPGSTAVGAVA